MATKLKLHPQDTVIVVIGPSGTGKSTFINVATQAQPGLETSTEKNGLLAPCTTEFGFASCNHPTIDGRRIVFIDTPALESTANLLSMRQDVDEYLHRKKRREGFLKTLRNYLKKAEAMKIHGAIYLHRIADNKVTEIGTLKSLRKTHTFNDARLVLGTTMWDDGRDIEKKEKRLEELRDLWVEEDEPANKERFRGDVMQYFNTPQSAWNIISKVI